PYLSLEHGKSSTPIRQSSNVSNDSLKVVSLGIMLLEICYIPIEEILKPEDLGPNCQITETSYLHASRRWLMGNEEEGNFSYAFVEAISYCLQCFMNPGASLSNEAFLKTLEQKVLVPLEMEMDTLLFRPLQR
ncbi:hypothetical protein P280DRAFT_526740, partial [Massarina eburnea CBS 473.64]